MSKTVHISATAAVRRTLKGDTLSLALKTNGVPLFQGLNPDTYTVSPAWTSDGTHPVITPSVGSARGNNVTLTNHVWAYNGQDLGFSLTQTTGRETSTVNDAFQMNHADGSLAIVRNLASKTNQDSDTLTYSGTAKMGSSEYTLEKSIDILVSMLSGSSYFGGVSADITTLSKGQTQCKLTPWLFNSAGGEVTAYSVKLYRGNSNTLAGTYNNPSQGITIHRDKTDSADLLYVDSHQLFILEFIVDDVAVYRTGISIDDISDIYQANLVSEGQVDDTTNQTFRIQVINTESGKEADVASGSVTFNIYTDDDGKMTTKRTATMSWADMQTSGFVVKDSDTRDDDNNIISVSVSADATLEIN